MDMAYRELVPSLAARLQVLEAQVGERTRERDEVARLLAEAREHVRREDDAAAAPARRRRRRRWLVAMIGMVVAIGGVVVAMRSTRRPDPTTVAIHRLEGFTYEMCACLDNQCATQVSNEMTEWAQSFKDAPPVKPDEETMKYVTQVAMTLANCMQHAMSTTTTPPSP